MAITSAWETELSGAFSVLLGRPLDDFDHPATYVLYLALTDESFDFDSELFGSVLPPTRSRFDFDPHTLGLDLARSLFIFDGNEIVTGRDAVGRDLDEDGAFDALVRVDTDGTLFAALRAATWTAGDGPGDLVAMMPGVMVEPEWADALSRVGDAALRDHLGMLCLDAHYARAYGAYYLGTGKTPVGFGEIAERPDHTFVAGWRYGEQQGGAAIFQVASPE